MTPWVRHGACREGCGACCVSLMREVTLRVTPEVTEPAYWAARGFPLHTDRTVVVTGRLVAPCPQLTSLQRCGLHGTPDKPRHCQDYPTAPEQIAHLPCSYWFTRDGRAWGGLASPYPAPMSIPQEEAVSHG